MDENNTPGNTLILPADGYYPISNGGAWDAYSCGIYWARDNNVAKRLIFVPSIEDAYIDNTGVNVDDRLLVRFIIDESIDATGVGVDFNGYNDMILWW